MMLARVFVLVLCFFNAKSAVFEGKGLFCRDPDTGKLHPINATWPSTTFCGNYICKLRKINTEVQEPVRELNVTDLNFNDEKVANETVTNSTGKLENREIPEVFKIVVPDARMEIPTQEILSRHYANPDDRYLTESEIKEISNVLHKVKKSDIDALVEVYTLAQEIYHEMDRITDQEASPNSVNNVKEKIPDNKGSRKMEGQSAATHSNYLYLTNNLKKHTSKYSSYFNGPLTMKDFGKIPYYYPISSFQRMSSYVHQPSQRIKMPVGTSLDPEKMNEESTYSPFSQLAYMVKKDQQKLIQPSYLLPYPFSYVNNYTVNKYANTYSSNPWVWDYHHNRNKQTPYLKAYLAHVPPYTGAILVNPHLHDEEPEQNIQQPIQKSPNSEYVKNEDNIQWKTKPLSSQTINEIKANVDTHGIKAFPFRKKVKIEKVGKIIKMDELTRSRRDTNEVSNLRKKYMFNNLEKSDIVENLEKLTKRRRSIDGIDNSENNQEENAEQRTEKYLPIPLVAGEYEAVIEKIICQPEMVPGYFRYGNLTEPYPQCCPQLIPRR